MKLELVNGSAASSTATPATPVPSTAPATGTALPARSVAHAPQPASAEAAKQAAALINDFLKSSSANIEFSVDAGSDHVIVRVVDSATNELIRQIPSEETLAIARALDRMTGLLLSQKA